MLLSNHLCYFDNGTEKIVNQNEGTHLALSLAGTEHETFVRVLNNGTFEFR